MPRELFMPSFASTSQEKPASSEKRPVKKAELAELDPKDVLALDDSEEEAIEATEVGSGEFQETDLVPAFEIHGFGDLDVVATLEKKDERKKDGGTENRNEDTIIFSPAIGLLGVLDGLGSGKGKGADASMAAERLIPERYTDALRVAQKKDPRDLQNAIVEQQLTKSGLRGTDQEMTLRVALTQTIEMVLTRDAEIAEKAFGLIEGVRATNDAIKETGGQTTACLAVVHRSPDGSRWAIVANVGDSGAYKRRVNGELVSLTEEDSLLKMARRTGFINEDLLKRMKADPGTKFPIPITLEIITALGGTQKDFESVKGRTMPMSYNKLKTQMTSCLGGGSAEASLSIRELRAGEELILATDGVIDKFEDPVTEETDMQEMRAAFAGNEKLIDRADHARQAAKNKKVSYKDDDDIAMIIARVPKNTT